MEKKNTPIQTAIEKLEEKIQPDRFENLGIKTAIELLESLLPMEREVIETANFRGQLLGFKQNPSEQNAKHYFTQTFKTEK